jgi:hypothetical protein
VLSEGLSRIEEIIGEDYEVVELRPLRRGNDGVDELASLLK